jgi:Peptidase A4 family
MQRQNWPALNRFAIAVLFVASISMSAAAQREDANAIFATAPKVSTKVDGVSMFATPPKDFNPLTATNVELLTYGLPQRPDKVADERAYGIWERAMVSTRIHPSGVEAKPYSSREMIPASGMGEKTNANGTTAVGSFNWSGIANSNKNTKWNTKTSFTQVASVWNVPAANAPFGIPCAGPFWEVSWNGIDGYGSGDVVQGGSSSYTNGGACGGPIQYFGWVEWFPSYPILQVNCGSSACPVNAGDDFFVVTFAAPGFSNQNVYINDLTQGWATTINLAWQSGPGVVGNTAEYIVERPCCYNNNNYPLGNYIYEFFDFGQATDGNGTQFFPGSSSPSTLIFTMVADDGTTPISHPRYYGSSGNQGKYSIWMEDLNCTYIGGCTP